MNSYIFVYGLLKSTYENEPAKFIRKNCSLLGEGYFPGQLIDIGSYPGALYEEDSEMNVYGEVYKIEKNEAELVAYLDHFEGVGKQFEQPNEYVREVIPVQMGDTELKASCYLYNWSIKGKTVVESGRYENKDGTR
ncbi:MAG: gamma-glutamylcyclotransferase [Balneola sp.]|nr:MAG: gamma-glutamylcyclotransferase [Balneola sp.]